MMKKLLFHIKNSIKIKIILIYIASLIIVYLVTWMVLSAFLFRSLEDERVQNMRSNSEKIVEDVQVIKENYGNILYRLSNNHIIYKSLSNRCKQYEQVWEALTGIKYTLSEDMARSSIIKRLEVYQQGSDIGEDGKYVFNDRFDSAVLENTGWITELDDKTALLCRYQKISALYNNVEAYIRIGIDSQEAFGPVTEIKGDIAGLVYLTDEENVIIASSEADAVGKHMSNILPDTRLDYEEGSIAEQNNIMVMKNSVDEKWNVWVFISSSHFENQVKHAKLVVGLILLSYGIFSGMALSILLNHVFKRLHKLGEKMEQIQGDISYIAVHETGDEVAVLEAQYNSMLKKLENVIDEMAEVKSQKQKFEFKSLESQINPHFLYNTLGVMRWEALESQNPKLVTMLDDLTAFYRLSLNKGRGLLSVEQELNLVRAYINIQQMRWDHVVEVKLTMDSELKDITVPKMILQPLVENIWLHGNITAPGNRKVEINAKDCGINVEFKIWDNGDGIPEEVLQKFRMNRETDGDSFGIGIQFIGNILNYYYGNHFVYEITSNRQSGTLIRIRLPKEMGGMK